MPSGYIEKLDGTKIEIVDAKSRADILTKQDKLVAGENINITGNTISADEPTIVQTITSGVEIGKINDTSLYVNEINYVDADVDGDGNIVLFGGNSDDGNVGDGISALQSVIDGKYSKPSTGIPESDLSDGVRGKLNSSKWEKITSITVTEDSSATISLDDNGDEFSLQSVYIIAHIGDKNINPPGTAIYLYNKSNVRIIGAYSGAYSNTNTEKWTRILFTGDGNFIKNDSTAQWYGSLAGIGLSTYYTFGKEYIGDANVTKISFATLASGTDITVYGVRC